MTVTYPWKTKPTLYPNAVRTRKTPGWTHLLDASCGWVASVIDGVGAKISAPQFGSVDSLKDMFGMKG